jgi:hypothetical protein
MVNVNESDGPVGGIVQSVAASWTVPDSSPAMVYYTMTLDISLSFSQAVFIDDWQK